ncbi:hypothetical protein ES703_66853 [subsurface metagenome]
MPMSNKTIRRMSPVARQYAHLIQDLASIVRKLDNLTEKLHRLERDSLALDNSIKSANNQERG